MDIRLEQAADRAAVHSLNTSAFETAAEANLVDVLRESVSPVISLVATNANDIVGHIMFSPVTLSEMPEVSIMGLAPMAVAEKMRGKGIGTALVKSGIKECSKFGVGAIVVLGHSRYYPRFGFRPASCFQISASFKFMMRLLWH